MPEVEEYDVYTNFGRSPIVAIVPDVGEWFDRRDMSLASWSAGWLHFQGATSCLREYGRKRTRRKGRYGRTRRSRRDPLSCPNVQGPTSASERTDWSQRSRDFCLPLHPRIYIVALHSFHPARF